MKFGTIGGGAVALAFAREALAAGHEVVLSNRHGPHSLAGKVAELGRGASAATVEEAAGLDYVLFAVPWPNVEDALRGLPAWNGRVLIDATNPFAQYSPQLVPNGPLRLVTSHDMLYESHASRLSPPSAPVTDHVGLGRAQPSEQTLDGQCGHAGVAPCSCTTW